MGSRITIELREDGEGEGNTNATTKEWSTDSGAIYLQDALRVMTEALRGFGYVIHNDEGLIVGKRKD